MVRGLHGVVLAGCVSLDESIIPVAQCIGTISARIDVFPPSLE